MLMIDFISELLTNVIFLSVFFSWLISQGLKTIVLAVKDKRFSFGLVLRRGNMPSSHSATVAGLTTAVFISEGVTVLSVSVLTFSIVVLRDLLDVNIGLPDKQKIGLNLRTYIHKPTEVAVGIITGIITAGIVYMLVSL